MSPSIMSPEIRDISLPRSLQTTLSHAGATDEIPNENGHALHSRPKPTDKIIPPDKPLFGDSNGVSAEMTVLGNTALPVASIEPVNDPFAYINSLPSKGVRGKLIDTLNVWIEVSPEALSSVRSVIADVHNLSLMLDDVQDNSPLRRGKPSTHCIFGMPLTVNSATYQIVDVLSRTWELGDAESMKAVLDEMKRLLIGQGHDINWTNLVSTPTVEEYLQMVDGKTGGVFRMISRLMIAQSKYPTKPVDLDRLMTLFGRFFQIRDDYENIISDQYMQAKGFCEDLDEGKYSFILIHALSAEPRLRTLLRNMLMERRVTGSAPIEHKKLILTLIRETGSLEYTAKVLMSLWHSMEEEIHLVEIRTGKPNPGLRKVIEALLLPHV